MKRILVVAALLLGACGPTEAERVDAEIRAWKAREMGAEEAEIWARRHCELRGFFGEIYADKCTIGDLNLTETEEIAFMRWLAARDAGGGAR